MVRTIDDRTLCGQVALDKHLIYLRRFFLSKAVSDLQNTKFDLYVAVKTKRRIPVQPWTLITMVKTKQNNTEGIFFRSAWQLVLTTQGRDISPRLPLDYPWEVIFFYKTKHTKREKDIFLRPEIKHCGCP